MQKRGALNLISSDVFKIYILDVTKLEIELSVRCKEIFKPELNNESTALYKTYEAKFTEGLSEAFNGTPGFQKIEVKRFKKGSIICDYNAVFNLLETNENTIKEINITVVERINNNALLGPVDKDYTKQSIENFIRSGDVRRFVNPCIGACPTGKTCSRTSKALYCKDSCGGFNCGAFGQCVLYIGQPKCRCDETSDVVYSGEKCDEEIEKLLLPTNYIIIISCSIFGIIIIITIIIVIVIKKRKHPQKKNDDNAYNSTQFINSAEMKNEIGEYSEYRRPWHERGNNNEYISDGRMRYDVVDERTRPIELERLSSNHNHRNGFSVDRTSYISNHFPSERNEMDIYQPRNISVPVSRSSGYYGDMGDRPNRHSFYDDIDTETVFVIRRPKITA
ncbi:hypothetical protein SNE40_022669 [Patella caerulea]|uniref:SEA domain-containing protein n=1 Tax=Patella caerulea TaxID=87958 RepID=A0AAN8FWU0_PATCE